MKHLICLAVLVAAARAESCSIAKPMKDLDPSKALGKWRVIHGKTPDRLERTSRCLAIHIFPDEDGKLFSHMTGNDSNVDFTGPAIPNQCEPGVLTIHWKGNVAYDVRFVKTDYDNYAVAVGCKHGDKLDTPTYMMIFSRTTTLPDDTIRMLKKELTDIGIDITGLVELDQNGC